jgi:pimeloyl-ACP methyl ester carboxylesterase
MRGTQAEDEQDQPDEGKMLRVPVLTISGLNDLVARPEQLHESLKGWTTAGHTIRDLETGHWVMYEDPNGVNTNLLEFLRQ